MNKDYSANQLNQQLTSLSFPLSADEEDSSGPPDTNVVLRYNGEITWDSPAITKSSCKVDVSYFPFDSQECNLTFGSWTYNGNQVYVLDFIEA